MNKRLNIPNALSVLRILTIPVIIFLILHTNSKNFPLLIVVYSFSTGLDFFDGYLARKLSQETELGKILDPIADKLMVFSLVLALSLKADFPIWLGVIIVFRDILITIITPNQKLLSFSGIS
jgi:cardiolipin synthase (CMP-forming)